MWFPHFVELSLISRFFSFLQIKKTATYVQSAFCLPSRRASRSRKWILIREGKHTKWTATSVLVPTANESRISACHPSSDFCGRTRRFSTSRIGSGSRNWPTNWAKVRGAENAEMTVPVSSYTTGGKTRFYFAHKFWQKSYKWQFC